MSHETRKIIKAAFPPTIPVLTGYLAIGLAFGIMFQEKGYNWMWAALMSLLVYAGSGQYLAVNFFVPGFSFVSMIFMTFMVNVRHFFYGLSILGRVKQIEPKKRWYITFALTDETYSLFAGTKTPEGIDNGKFMFAIAVLNHSYWIIGSIVGALAGSMIHINMAGIDFAMTALFVVIFIEQWLVSNNHISAFIGIGSAFVCLLIFGPDRFILPSMILIMVLLLICRKWIDQKRTGEEETEYAD